MVFVDFSNPYLRNYLQNNYIRAHAKALGDVCKALPAWAEESRRDEAQLAAASGRKPRPLAVVLDIDEVILSNIHMNTFRAGPGEQGDAPVEFHAADFFTAPDGRPWPRDDLRLNPLLPGARALLELLHSLSIRVFFITGRLETIRDETVENFEFVGLAGAPGAGALFDSRDLARPDGSLVMCPAAEYPPPGQSVRPYKEARRRAIQTTHRIVCNVGDQVSDLGLFGDVQIHISHPFYATP